MKKVYLAPAINVIALDNVSPILAGSTGAGSQTIRDQEPYYGSGIEPPGTGTGSGIWGEGSSSIGFGKGPIDDTE